MKKTKIRQDLADKKLFKIEQIDKNQLGDLISAYISKDTDQTHNNILKNKIQNTFFY